MDDIEACPSHQSEEFRCITSKVIAKRSPGKRIPIFFLFSEYATNANLLYADYRYNHGKAGFIGTVFQGAAVELSVECGHTIGYWLSR